MAGTRLVLTLISVVQLLVLFVSSFYLGLCRHSDDIAKVDFICIPLFHQGGRSLLQQRWHEEISPLLSSGNITTNVTNNEISIVVAVHKEEKENWLSKLQKIEPSAGPFQPVMLHPTSEDVSDEIWKAICGDSDEKSDTSNLNPPVDIWICPSSLSLPSTSRLRMRDGSIRLFGDSLLETNFHSRQEGLPTCRQSLVWTTLTDPRSDSGIDAQEWHTWWNQVVLAPSFARALRMFERVDRQQQRSMISLFDMAEAVPNVSDNDTTENSTTLDSDNTVATRQTYQLSLQAVVNALEHEIDRGNDDDSTWRITIWIPRGAISAVTDAAVQSRLIQASSRHLVAVLDPPSTSSLQSTKENVQDLADKLVTAAVATSLPTNISSMDSRFMQSTASVKLWKQHCVDSLYKEALSQVKDEYQRLHNSRWTVPITAHVVEAWSTAARHLNLVEADFTIVMDNIRRTLNEIDALRRDPFLVEPLDLSPDHYAGIFVPLMVPLLLPLLIGIVRERRRIRDKRKKKNDMVDKEKKDK